jgi:transposase
MRPVIDPWHDLSLGGSVRGELISDDALRCHALLLQLVKRQKNDAADAEAICEAAPRPTRRFVAPKSEQTQAAALVFRARDLLVKQRTQTINALRGHLAEFGIAAARGHMARML